MRKLLLIVDVQNGFINEVSAWLPAKLAEYIKKSDYTDVFATRYINHTCTPCYVRLGWKGCMDENEQAICSELDGLYTDVFDKDTYSAVTQELLTRIFVENYDEIHVVGIATTCCVVATVYELFDKGYNVKAIPALCSVTGTLEGFQEAGRYMLKENVPCIEMD